MQRPRSRWGIIVGVLLSSVALAPSGAARARTSRAKVINARSHLLVKFVAARGERAHVTISMVKRHCTPGPGIRNPCLAITDSGSLVGYEYHTTQYLGRTQFDYGCLNRQGPKPGHRVVCPLDYPLHGPIDGLELDLRRASSAEVTLIGLSLRSVRVEGSPGPDVITGKTSAAEVLFGGRGDDTLEPHGKVNVVHGGPGDDTFRMLSGVHAVVRGGPGSDTLDYSGLGHGITVDLARAGPKLSIENVVGTQFDDKLIGNAAANHLSGSGGNDLLIGGPGADTLSGGPGDDTVSYAGDPHNVSVSLDGRADDGEPGEHDNVAGDVETIVGGDGNDHLTGDDAPHTLIGGLGDDILTGGNSNDRLIGDAANDTLLGGEGDDVLTGGPGNDSFSCGTGADDRVTDWHPGDQAGADCSRPHIYWTNNGNGTIGAASVDGTMVFQALISGADAPTSVVADAGHLYWSNAGDNTIGRAGLDGRQVDEHFISSGGGAGLAVDGQHIYWVNQYTNTIGRANLNGGDVEANFITGADLPIGIALNGAHLYWTNSGDGTVGRASLDGTHVNQSFIRVGGSPLGLALDTNNLYWADADANAIGKVSITAGGVPGALISALASPRALAVGDGRLYWGNFAANAVGRADLTGGSVSQSFIPGGDGVLGVVVSPPGFVSFS